MNILAIILAICNLCIDGAQKHTVMAISGLNLRAEASKTSKIVKTLEFGSIIYSGACHAGPEQMDKWYKRDTINDIEGHWIEAESKEFNLKGYLFSPYVYYGDLVDNKIDKNEMRFSQEGIVCEKFDYHPDLIWFGVYKGENSFDIRKVEIEIQLSKVKFDSTYLEFVSSDYESIIMKTTNSESAEFLIGTNDPYFIEREVNTIYKADNLGYTNSCESGFLYPNMKKHFQFENRRYQIVGLEDVVVDTTTMKVKKNYDVKFQIWEKSKIKYSKSIRKDLDLCCDAELHANYQTPQLYWVGDINNDSILDCIIHQHTMTEGCGVEWQYSLFLSKIKNEDITLNFIDRSSSCN